MNDAALAGLARDLVAYGLLPLWIAAGFADWLCHRATGIERTTGLREATLHAGMLAALGLPTLAVVFLEINALVVALMLVGYALHEALLYADLRYSADRRSISPIEQMVHSFLEVLPLVGGTLVLLFNWPAVRSLWGGGDTPPDWQAQVAQPPVPLTTLAALGAALAVFVALPYLEELVRCWRWRDRHSEQRPGLNRSA